MFSSESDKATLFAKKFCKNSNLDDSGISLPVFPSRTNLKPHSISVTSKMVRKVIINLDLSKASGPDCIPVVVLKNCELELSYILAELFNKCVQESCFPDCWKNSSVVPVFQNAGERSTAKNYHPVSLLSVVSKVFEKLVNNRIVDHLEKCGLFLISSMVLGPVNQLQIFSQLYLIELLGLLTSLGLLELWHLIYPRLNISKSDIQPYFFLSNRQLRVVLDGKSSQEYPVNAGVSFKGSILGPTLFLLYINNLPDDVIYNIAIYADHTTLYSKCDQASDLWQQLD